MFTTKPHSHGADATVYTASSWTNIEEHLPVAASQHLDVPSKDAVNTQAPSDENTAEHKQSWWPSNANVHTPVSALHSLHVQSADAVSTEAPSGENTAEFK